MCDNNDNRLKSEKAQGVFDECANMMERRIHKGDVFELNTGQFTARCVNRSDTRNENSGTVDGDGVSPVVALVPQQSPHTSSHWPGNHEGETTMGDSLSSSLLMHSLFTANTAADLSPTLLTVFLSYSEEMTMAAQTTSSIVQRDLASNCHQSDAAFDFIKTRLFPSGNLPSPCVVGVQEQQQRRRTVALSWFLQQHCEHAATVLSMGFSFLLNLENYTFSWKRAVEVPLMALQLRATYAHAVAFDMQHNIFAALNPREHLVLMAACLLVCWKFADVDASATMLIAVLEHSFFRHHSVLRLRDVVQMELVVLRVCGACVETPRWWTVAIELLAAAHSEMEEQYSSHRNGGDSLTKSFEEKLELLLMTSEQVLLFVMNVDGSEAGVGNEKRGLNRNTNQRHHRPMDVVGLAELRTTLRCWMESHPIFGVALAVASGVVTLPWAASCIAPTATAYNHNKNRVEGECRNENEETSHFCLFPLSNIQRSIHVADDAAQRELCGMVEVLTEVLRRSWRVAKSQS